jgi:hypothetical protein
MQALMISDIQMQSVHDGVRILVMRGGGLDLELGELLLERRMGHPRTTYSSIRRVTTCDIRDVTLAESSASGSMAWQEMSSAFSGHAAQDKSPCLVTVIEIG